MNYGPTHAPPSTSSVQHHKPCRPFYQTKDASGDSQKEGCPPVSSPGECRAHRTLLRRGRGLTEGPQGQHQCSSPSRTEGSKPHSCPLAGLSLWAIKKQTFRHTTHLVTPRHYLHAPPSSAWSFCCCPSKAPKSPSCTTQSTLETTWQHLNSVQVLAFTVPHKSSNEHVRWKQATIKIMVIWYYSHCPNTIHWCPAGLYNRPGYFLPAFSDHLMENGISWSCYTSSMWPRWSQSHVCWEETKQQQRMQTIMWEDGVGVWVCVWADTKTCHKSRKFPVFSHRTPPEHVYDYL